MNRYAFDGFSLALPDGWYDCTDDLGVGPITVARADGVGALQFTIAAYRSGPLPAPSPTDLYHMVLEAAAPHADTPPFEVVLETRTLTLAAASFVLEGTDFLRVWYVSDGLNFAKATYLCGLQEHRSELPVSEAIVRSLHFSGGTA